MEIPITDWLTAIGTLGAVILAISVLFINAIRRYYRRPVFRISFGNEEPFCRHSLMLATEIHEEKQVTKFVHSYWIRLRVENSGRSLARGCEGKLVRIANAANTKARTDFDPVILHWVGSTHNPIDINSTEYEYLDLVYTRDDDPHSFYIAGEERSPRGINLSPPRQDYILSLVIYGENVSPLAKSLYLRNDAVFDRIELTEWGPSRTR
jgi:hypothetical protein